MDYKEIYKSIVQKKNIKILRKSLEEIGIFDKYNTKSLFIQEIDGFPFVLMRIQPDETSFFSAMMLGFFLDNLKDFNLKFQGEYYFPTITIVDKLPKNIDKRIVNIENAINHELIHLKQVLAIIENDPSYLEKVKTLGVYNSEKEQIEASIDFETYKIFTLEPDALKNDYKAGEKTIRTQFMGRLMEYDCDTQEEYVYMQIYDYIGHMKGIYVKKFPDFNKELIDTYFNDSIIKHSDKILGDDPITTLEELNSSYAEKMLHGTINKLRK